MGVIFILIWIVCGIVSASIGAQKNMGCLGAFLGFVLGPFGLLIVVVMPDDSKVECPHCREKIHHQATICPHCRMQLKSESQPEVDGPPKNES